jgi:hypothetical protein
VISEWSGRVARFLITIHFSPITIHDLALRLNVRFCFRKTDNFAALFPLASLLQQFDALETLQNITLGGNGARAF